jgi:hypothetical protein
MKSMAIGLMIALTLIGCATIQKDETLERDPSLDVNRRRPQR